MTLTVTSDTIRDACPDWAQNILLAGYRGSESHGTSIFKGEHATDDVDVFAVSVQPEEWYVGLNGYANKSRQVHETAGDDLDLLVYDVRKFFSLLAKGNPNVHVFLWLRPEHYLLSTEMGANVVGMRKAFLSRSCLDALCGYATAQFKAMERGIYRGYMGDKRRRLAEKYGFDPKHASHCFRLLYMGIELCQEGTMWSWRPDQERELLMEVKTGQWPLDKVKTWADELWRRYRTVEPSNDLPEFPDYNKINKLLVNVIREVGGGR